jgi:hypothetical protein
MPIKRLLRKLYFLVPSRLVSRGTKELFYQPRRRSRIALATHVRVEGHNFKFIARSVQLGMGGMSLEHAKRLPLALPVRLAFALPTGCALRVGARVWWKKGHLTGFRFAPARENYRAIEEWIELDNSPTWTCLHCQQVHMPATLRRLDSDTLECECCKRPFPSVPDKTRPQNP